MPPKTDDKNYAQIELGTLLSFIAEGLILFDGNGSITLVNPHASLLLDRTGNDLVGKNIDEVIRASFDGRLLGPDEGIVETVFKKQKPFYAPPQKTILFESQSGRVFPVFVSAKQVNIRGVVGGVLIFRDVTVEKELESYKINTAKRLSTLTPLLQRLATGDFSVDIPLPREEDEFTELLVGLKLMIDDLNELLAERDRNEAEKLEVLEEKRKLTENYTRELERQVQEKVQELNQVTLHIETIIENLTSGLIEYDHGFALVRMNRAAEKILGVSRKEVIGKKILPRDIYQERLRSLVEVSYPALSDSARRLRKEVSRVDADVHEITLKYPTESVIQVVTAPIIGPFAGGREGLIKVLRDITREKIISNSKSEFISIAAHQLRTPLSGIKWVLHLLTNGDLGPLTPSQHKMLVSGYQTNEKMIQLVNDLLNVARIEDGRFGYSFQENDLVKVISQVLGNAKINIEERNIKLSFENHYPNIQPFFFDVNKVSLVIQNLVDNAIKYTTPGGKVTVILGGVGRYAEVKISDTGVGIPKNQIDRLFTKFFRAENVMHMQTSGSGLGLFIVRNIVARHGGQVAVQSKENEGTTFSFTLPLEKRLIPQREDQDLGYY